MDEDDTGKFRIERVNHLGDFTFSYINIVRQNIAKIYPNLEIHTEVYILIDYCSVEARVIISTRTTKFHPVAIF